MPYIPQFNKLSFQEQAYAPTLMRQQHDEAVAKQMELADALKFDYLKQDAPILEPVLNKYSEDINKVSTDLAKNGFTQDTKSKLLGLRSQYTSDDKIRQVKKNYEDAMQGWEETKKALIQRGASGDLLNKQKASYFGAYKGSFDDEGFKQDFTAGRTSGVYDITEDAKKAMTNLGQTGRVVGSSGSSIVEKTGVGADKRPFTYFEVTDNKTGQVIKNADQRAAVEAYLLAEYRDESTDRGLYAKIAGLTPEHIQNAIANVSRSVAEDRYTQLPQQDTNISGMQRATSAKQPFSPGYLRQSGYGVQPQSVNDLGHRVYSDFADKLASDEARKLGLDGVKNLDDLIKMSGQFKEQKPAVQSFMGPQTVLFKTESGAKAKQALDNIENNLKSGEYGTALPTYEINPLMLASGKSINEADKLQKGFDEYITRHIDRFTPIKGNKEDFSELVKNVTVTDFSPNFKEKEAGIVLYLKGEDKNGKIKNIPVTLDSKDTNTEEALVQYLTQMNPIIGVEYQYGKQSDAGKKQFLKELELSIPNSESEEEALSKVQFINSKRALLR